MKEERDSGSATVCVGGGGDALLDSLANKRVTEKAALEY